jgi:hypothetical protein
LSPSGVTEEKGWFVDELCTKRHTVACQRAPEGPNTTAHYNLEKGLRLTTSPIPPAPPDFSRAVLWLVLGGSETELGLAGHSQATKSNLGGGWSGLLLFLLLRGRVLFNKLGLLGMYSVQVRKKALTTNVTAACPKLRCM